MSSYYQEDQPRTDISQEPLASVHTSNFSNILRHFGISLAVTTYQAGRLVFLRDEEGVVNTHFRALPRPMGMYADGGRLVVGTQDQIVHFINVPATAPKLESVRTHDGCYVPRSIHFSGDIDIHEMEYANDQLWFVNTRFSALCTLDPNYSFVPVWRPHFISQLTPEDRCHLNGLCMVDGKPKFVTALGATDSYNGWRENKKDGGILMDVESNRILLDKLSMPHSPRIYNGKLWLLESGDGSLGTVDLAQKKYTPICRLDGFTRGIAFIGNIAFVGLSQVRESAIFGGIPLGERIKDSERICGVWAIDIRNGEVVAFLKFTSGVNEIFSISILPDMRYPEILEFNDKLVPTTYTLPDEYLKDVPEKIAIPDSEKPS